MALIEWLPAASVEMVKVATPLASSVPVPSVVVPSLNVTVPVGVPGDRVGEGDRRRERHRLADDRRVERRGQGRGRRRLVDRLAERGRGAGREVAVAVVVGRLDRMIAEREGGGR